MASSVRELTARLLAHALRLPGAWEDHPWGENVAKVGKKVFVFFGVPDPRGEEMIVCVKLPQSGLAALDRGIAEPAGYGLGKSGWVMARFGAGDAPSSAVLEGWIEESYRAIAPKKLAAQLDGGGASKAGVPAAAPKAGRARAGQAGARKAGAKPKPKVGARPQAPRATVKRRGSRRGAGAR